MFDYFLVEDKAFPLSKKKSDCNVTQMQLNGKAATFSHLTRPFKDNLVYWMAQLYHVHILLTYIHVLLSRNLTLLYIHASRYFVFNFLIIKTYNWLPIFIAANFDGGHHAGTVTSNLITEASGICASRTHQDVLYTHNDSGDTHRIFAIRYSSKMYMYMYNVKKKLGI